MFEEKKMLSARSDADFELIYKATIKVLYKIAFNVIREDDTAEDVCHDALIKMTEKDMKFPSINDAKYWLIRVVRNASLNYVKRRNRASKAYMKAFREDTRTIDSGETAALKAETTSIVKDALDQLPEKLRVVLQLKEYGELNYKEIGRLLGITEGNVKIRVFRAREQLSKLIGENDVYMS